MGRQLVYKALTWLEKRFIKGFQCFHNRRHFEAIYQWNSLRFDWCKNAEEKGNGSHFTTMYEPTSTETDCEGHPSAGYSKRTPFLCKLLSVLVHFNNYGIWFAVCRQSMIVKAFSTKTFIFHKNFSRDETARTSLWKEHCPLRSKSIVFLYSAVTSNFQSR